MDQSMGFDTRPIRVAVRVRPINNVELSWRSGTGTRQTVVETEGEDTVHLKDPLDVGTVSTRHRTYTTDWAFDEKCSNRTVYVRNGGGAGDRVLT